jgi:hypothetical protein
MSLGGCRLEQRDSDYCEVPDARTLSRQQGGSRMNEYVFEVRLRARVRVRAPNEVVAKNVVPSVLGAPGTLELDLANENNAAIGWAASNQR